MQDLFENVFWTKPMKGEVPLDPLGLDAMREQLSNKLVPCLTGRTSSINEAFWTIVFLRWSSSELGDDVDVVARFLYWERCLKLVWAHYNPDESFAGIEQSRKQAQSTGAPTSKYKRLLVNPRAQGMMGSYLRPLKNLGLVRKDKISLTETALLWTESCKNPPKLVNGDWKQWQGSFQLFNDAFKTFRGKFHSLLKSKMPEIYLAFDMLSWPEKEAWNKASLWLGPNSVFANLAHDFCKWADEIRIIFDSLVFEQAKTVDHWPTFAAPIPAELNDLRWNRIRQFCTTSAQQKLNALIEWHFNEMKERGREEELWITYSGDKLNPQPYFGSSSKGLGGDCRWSNIVAMMKPRY